MQVELFKWANLLQHVEADPVMLKAFLSFRERIQFCDWSQPSDIIKSFRTADIVTCLGVPFNRVVFNVGGNKYRLICGYRFSNRKVLLYIRFVGTHQEYDQVEVCSVNMF